MTNTRTTIDRVTTDNRDEWGRKLAQLRQGKTDPGSPCMRCKRDRCPPVCYPKHDFERRRPRQKD